MPEVAIGTVDELSMVNDGAEAVVERSPEIVDPITLEAADAATAATAAAADNEFREDSAGAVAVK